ncbi:MAG: hypothetical protein ACF788_06940 [Novipirellula sp. JB048]
MTIAEVLGDAPGELEIEVVTSDEEFNSEAESRTLMVKLDDDLAEQEYERMDSTLASRIDELLTAELASKAMENVVHQIYDWWPNRTRFIEIDARCVSWELLTKFQSLLVDRFEDWTINIQVYDQLDSTDAPHLGAVNVYATGFLVTHR